MHPIKTALVAKMLLLLMIVNVVATPLPMRPAGKPHTKTGERPLGSGPIDDNDLNPVWRHFDLVRQIVNSKGQLVYVNWKADISKDEDEYSAFTALLAGVESRVPSHLYINNLLTRSKESIPWVSARKSQEVEDFDFDETWSKGPFFKMLCMKGTAAGSVVTAYWWGVYDEIEMEF